MKKILLFVLVILAVLIGLFYINPQVKPAHMEPYLALSEESQAPPPSPDEVVQRVLLYGDAGHSSIDPWQPSMAKVAARASMLPEQTIVIALGDNIYYEGFPRKEAGQQEWTDDQLDSISYLDAQLKVAEVSGASLYLVPGNHDWYATEVDSQALYIEQFGREHDTKVFFEPRESAGLPLPQSLDFPGVSIVFVDSQWWLTGDEQHKSEAAMAEEFARIRQEHPENLIIVAQHHPLVTEGPHGGYLSDFRYWLIMNILYQVFPDAASQDTQDPNYQQMIQAQNRVMRQYDGVIHAAGHEHSLQLMQPSKGTSASYLLVSGAGNSNKVSGIWHNDSTRFAHSKEGFIELDITASGVYFRAFSIHRQTPTAEFWLDLSL
jgi:hypothetical protein